MLNSEYLTSFSEQKKVDWGHSVIGIDSDFYSLGMLLNIRLQIFVDLSFGWRAAFYVASEVSGAMADTEFASLSTVALSDTDFFV